MTLHESAELLQNGVLYNDTLTIRDAVQSAFEWCQADLPDTCLGLLLRGRCFQPGDAPRPLAVATFRSLCSNEGWSVTPIDAAPTQILVFQRRSHRSTVPTWVWHRLVGELLLPHDEIVVT